MKNEKELWIIDKYGYAIDKTDGVIHQSCVGDFMYPHEYVLSLTTGAEYYFCNGYDVAEIEDMRQHNCAVAMSYGCNCQCGQH